jgi:hypothetical protein
MKTFSLSTVSHIFIKNTDVVGSFRNKIENDLYSQPMLGISKDGFIVRSRSVIRDVTKVLKEETVTKREKSTINYNNRLMGIPIVRKTTKKSIIKEKKNEHIQIIEFEGKQITIIKQGL